MKTIFTQKFYVRIFVCLILLLNNSIKKADAQYVNIPDANFRSWLMANGFSSCMAGNTLDTTCSVVVNATHIYCYSYNISDLTGIKYFVNLDSLDCGSNQLTFLPNLPASLTYLICRENLLTSLPNLPPFLKFIECNFNLIDSLPNLPSTLLHLECIGSPLSSLPNLPSSLIYLACGDSLLNFPTTLPPSLQHLGIYNTPLSFLPNLPASLANLICENDQLSSLPAFPPSLRIIYINNNNLSNIPTLPDTVIDLNISNNPISCLPEIKNITNWFNWTNTNIHCLPNHGNIVWPEPPINNLPLCQLSDSCPSFWNITGNVYLDNNANCTQDINDFGLENIPVSLDSGNVQLQQVLTNIYGEYSFRTCMGNYIVRVDTTNIPYQVVCPVSFSHASVLTSIDSIDVGLDFGMQCNAAYDLEARSISPGSIFVVGTQLTLYIDAGDVCAAGISGSVQAILNGPVSYASSLGLIPSSVNGDTITWNISDFSLVNPTLDFNIRVDVSTSATIVDSACIQLNVLPNTDADPSNNFLQACYPIRSSFDPNEKYMSPSGLVDTSQQWFTFTVFFQNTGNYPAQQIYILDTLDNNLDATSFVYLSSSHHVITQLLPGNILRFNYPAINLADSTSDEPASHGYVQFKIKRKANLPVGTTITNTAYIFFDYNAAVVTNQTSATLSTNVNVNEISVHKFNIYPNPSNGEFTLSFSNHVGEKALMKIYNMLGETVFEKRFTVSSSFTMNRSEINLQKGMYVIEVSFENYGEKKKLIVE
jgi:uncharacterized repeat protein (TIGR01451 family)